MVLNRVQAYKPNAAFFEQFGADGHKALVTVLASIPPEVPVVYDAKRGDIGTTSEAYAAAALGDPTTGGLGAACVTVNPYMGTDSLEPFLRDPARGAFLLCKTSNPGSADLQALPTEGGLSVYERVAALAAGRWSGRDNVGLVVGATDAEAVRRVRAQAPRLWLLCPGVGAQGGDLAACCAAGLVPRREPTVSHTGAAAAAGSGREGALQRPVGLLFPVSRGISKAADPAAAARQLRDLINAQRDVHLLVNAQRDVHVAAAASLGAAAVGRSAGALAPYQRAFIDFAVANEVRSWCPDPI